MRPVQSVDEAPREILPKNLHDGIAHSIVGGTAWEATPWRAVQRAAWETLHKQSL